MKPLALFFLLSLTASAADVNLNLDAFNTPAAKEHKLKVITAEQSVKKGATFKVTLESNPSTGYSWRMLGDTGPVELLPETTEKIPAPKNPGKPNIVGAPGTQVFNFKAKTAGQQIVLVFTYGRPWEGLGDSCYQLKVIVEE